VAVRLAETARRCWNWLAEAARDAWDSATTAAQMVKVRALEAASHFLATGQAKVQQVRGQLTVGVRVGWMRLVVLATLARQLHRRLPVALGVGLAAWSSTWRGRWWSPSPAGSLGSSARCSSPGKRSLG
jgi:hypothetical protein